MALKKPQRKGRPNFQTEEELDFLRRGKRMSPQGTLEWLQAAREFAQETEKRLKKEGKESIPY